MSYAIISLGGKQYRVQEGERLLVDRLGRRGLDLQPRVLLVGGDGKTDLAPSTAVTARVVGHELGEKIRIGKYRRRTGYKRHTGHRSRLTQIEIESIGAGARKAAAKPKAETAAPKAEAPKHEAAPKVEAPAAGLPEGYEGMKVAQIAAAASGWSKPELEAALGTSARTRTARTAIAALESASKERKLAMAHKKGLGSSRNGRDSNPKMLGVKLFAGQDVKAGMILVRQRGTRFRPGPGAGIGKDDTIFATRDGKVAFRTSGERRYISVG